MLELFVSNKDFQKDESCLRTIISRSYYASFLHSREFLKIKHKLKSDTTDDHRWVWQKLNDLGLDDQAKYLKFLKRKRLISDYEINDHSLTLNLAKECIIISDKIIGSLKF